MSSKLSKNQLEKYSRQIILKNIGVLGQKKILNSRVLVIGMGGLGCPVAEFLTRSGIGSIGIVDHDLVSLSNIHRQTLYDEKDLGKSKVHVAQKKLQNINSKTKINIFNFKLDKKKFIKIIKNYDYVVDGTDNFTAKLSVKNIIELIKGRDKKDLIIPDDVLSMINLYINSIDYDKETFDDYKVDGYNVNLMPFQQIGCLFVALRWPPW